MAVRLAILLHFHEPWLVDPATGRARLPWVRLRALKDHLGMIALLRRFQGLRLTVSLSPCLLQQLERQPDDDHLSLALKPPKDLTRDEVSFIVERFFHEHLVERFARYAELREKREARERLAHQDLRDLQVLSTLAWVHPLVLESRKELASLARKGSSFDENDKKTLFDACLELGGGVIPAWGELGRSGRVELATSAYHHPVLPLLCSPPVEGGADLTNDAREQLARAKAFHERVFGSPPAGVWPPELALSEPAFSVIAETGCGWTVADESSLIGRPREDVYRPHERDGTAVVFRDREISELVAYGYQGVAGRAAAAELVSRILRVQGAGDDPVVVLALDGARTWDSCGRYGLDFLRSFCEFVSGEPRVRTVTLSEAVSEGRTGLGALGESSWAPGGDFSPWSAAEAWGRIVSAGRAAQESGKARARDAVLVAEASDWLAAFTDERMVCRDDYLALFGAQIECAAASGTESHVAADGSGVLAAMSYHADGGVLTVELEPSPGKEAELARRRIELRVIEPVEARIAVAGGKLFACDIEGRPHGRPFGKASIGKTLVARLPLNAIGASGGEEVAFYSAIVEDEKVVERIPVRGPAWTAAGGEEGG